MTITIFAPASGFSATWSATCRSFSQLTAAGGCWLGQRRHGHAGAGQQGRAAAGRPAAGLGPGGEEDAGGRDALQRVGAGGYGAIELRCYII